MDGESGLSELPCSLPTAEKFAGSASSECPRWSPLPFAAAPNGPSLPPPVSFGSSDQSLIVPMTSRPTLPAPATSSVPAQSQPQRPAAVDAVRPTSKLDEEYRACVIRAQQLKLQLDVAHHEPLKGAPLRFYITRPSDPDPT
ncbi:hypothetical protein PAPYR_10665 [Paratrimastix pyriformis]|uniref:Uncharacterized protein n=1 Tax=Paratrimastix pyriformis TaxID=342808 RepID=A0ABQ8U8A7_9EUKA|nr:hypothetical protein PAPYR_10665 [Paratrimastix pyriformis]